MNAYECKFLNAKGSYILLAKNFDDAVEKARVVAVGWSKQIRRPHDVDTVMSINLIDGVVVGNKKELSASEALYGFCGWLTTREEKTVMSSSHNCAEIASLITLYCMENGLKDPSVNWEKKTKDSYRI